MKIKTFYSEMNHNATHQERQRIFADWHANVCQLFEVDCPNKLPMAQAVYTSGLFRLQSACNSIYEIAFQKGEENALNITTGRDRVGTCIRHGKVIALNDGRCPVCFDEIENNFVRT